MTDKSTWIKFHRKSVSWEWFKDSKTFHVFMYLILMAQFEDTKFRGQEIKRGQLMTGRKKISADTGISEQSIRTALSNLKSTNEITIKSTSKYSIITICNYNEYQKRENNINQQINQQINQRPTSNQPATNHIQEGKELKNEKNINKDKVKKRFSPPSVNDVSEYCISRNNRVNPETWINHYISNGWMVGRNKMKNWKAAVRTWENNDITPDRKDEPTVEELMKFMGRA